MLVDDATFRRLCRARDLLAAGYNAPIPLDRAARAACLSPFHFQRIFARTFGETPHDFLTRLRMDQARQLLAAGDLPRSPANRPRRSGAKHAASSLPCTTGTCSIFRAVS